jgi:hypothetical protein
MLSYLRAIIGITAKIAKIAITTPRRINFSDSCSNLKFRSVGYMISLMMLPFAVRNPVFYTRPRTCSPLKCLV